MIISLIICILFSLVMAVVEVTLKLPKILCLSITFFGSMLITYLVMG